MRQNKLVEQETRTDPNIFQKRQTIDYQQRNIFRIARNKSEKKLLKQLSVRKERQNVQWT